MKRNELAVKGSTIGVASQIINLFLKFVVRTFVIRFLGREVLGLDSVLLDMINMLSLAEMGITSAMLYRLYAPVIDNDIDRISLLMATYRRIYHYIAGIITTVGIILSLFLKWIITGISIPRSQIYIAFFLQLACSVSSYLLAYQRILLNADQKKHLCLLADLACNVVFSILKIGTIILFKNYAVFLIINVLQTIASNLILLYYSRKRYSYVDRQAKHNRDDLKVILHDTKDLLGNKLASYVYSSTDNLIISIFMGTGIVGTLSNYKYISTALRSLVSSAMSAIQPIIGNYLNSDIKKEEAFKTLQRYTFIRYVISGASALPLIVLSHLFVRIWTGNESYLLDALIPILLAADYYIGCVYGPLGEYILGMGLFKHGKYATYAGAICNALLSLLGVKFWGIKGVLLATVIGQLVIWSGDIIIIFCGYFSDFPEYRKKYLWSHFTYIMVVILSGVISFLAFNFLSIPSPLLKFVFGAIIIDIIFFTILYFCFCKTDEFTYAKNLIKTMVSNLNKTSSYTQGRCKY